MYSHEKIVSIAKKNQRAQQQKRRTNQKREINVKKQKPGQPQTRKQKSPRRRSKHSMPPKNTQQKNAEKRRHKQNSSETFLAKSTTAALNQSRIHMEKQQNRSFIKKRRRDNKVTNSRGHHNIGLNSKHLTKHLYAGQQIQFYGNIAKQPGNTNQLYINNLNPKDR